MSPVSHFLIGWLLANSSSTLSRRERIMITLAGVIPDIDGLGAIAEVATRNWENPILWYTNYHHKISHNIGFAILVAAASYLLSKQRWKTTLLVFVSFHLHLLGDLVGARGPDGYQWPLPYLQPFSKHLQLVWSGQWELNAWPNFVISITALVITFYLAWKRGYSPLEMVSEKADKGFVNALRNRFPI
ncbi:MAG: metal-dependent hydrolase [bacterium]|nr:metal-dependent hydrolase [bacterium]